MRQGEEELGWEKIKIIPPLPPINYFKMPKSCQQKKFVENIDKTNLWEIQKIITNLISQIFKV